MSPHFRTPTRGQVVEQLREQLQELAELRRPAGDEAVSTGCAALDRLLRQGGLRRGTLVEWLADAQGSGAGSLALFAGREACRAGGALVVVDRQRQFHPPAAARAGVDLQRTIVVRPRCEADENWAMNQALRSPAVGAALCWAQRLAVSAARRWQLAAESTGAMGLLVRPAATRGDPSWADVRWLVVPIAANLQEAAPALFPHARAMGRRLRVELLRLRGEIETRGLELEIDDEAGAVRVAAELAAATSDRRAARA